MHNICSSRDTIYKLCKIRKRDGLFFKSSTQRHNVYWLTIFIQREHRIIQHCMSRIVKIRGAKHFGYGIHCFLVYKNSTNNALLCFLIMRRNLYIKHTTSISLGNLSFVTTYLPTGALSFPSPFADSSAFSPKSTTTYGSSAVIAACETTSSARITSTSASSNLSFAFPITFPFVMTVVIPSSVI